PADLRTYGPADLRTYGPADLRTYGPTDLQTYGPTDLRTYGPTDLRTYGPTDLQTKAPWVHRSPERPRILRQHRQGRNVMAEDVAAVLAALTTEVAGLRQSVALMLETQVTHSEMLRQLLEAGGGGAGQPAGRHAGTDRRQVARAGPAARGGRGAAAATAGGCRPGGRPGRAGRPVGHLSRPC